MSHSFYSFRIGEILKCTGVPSDLKGRLTLGKEYVVIEFEKYGDDPEWNSIQFDDGTLCIINHERIRHRFERVAPDALLIEAIEEMKKFMRAV